MPPFTRFVTAVTVASSAPLSHIDQSLFESKKNAAEASGYLVATKLGFANMSSSTNLENPEENHKKRVYVIIGVSALGIVFIIVMGLLAHLALRVHRTTRLLERLPSR